MREWPGPAPLRTQHGGGEPAANSAARSAARSAALASESRTCTCVATVGGTYRTSVAGTRLPGTYRYVGPWGKPPCASGTYPTREAGTRPLRTQRRPRGVLVSLGVHGRARLAALLAPRELAAQRGTQLVARDGGRLVRVRVRVRVRARARVRVRVRARARARVGVRAWPCARLPPPPRAAGAPPRRRAPRARSSARRGRG